MRRSGRAIRQSSRALVAGRVLEGEDGQASGVAPGGPGAGTGLRTGGVRRAAPPPKAIMAAETARADA